MDSNKQQASQQNPQNQQKDPQQNHQLNTTSNVMSDGKARLPHERDASPDGQGAGQQDVIRQAAKDLEQGLVDTDMHGERGQEKVAPKPAKSAVPVNTEEKNLRKT
jgi:hypothetical protein